jgi:hypothetical protein
MPSKNTERALELRAGDIIFYSSSDPESWLIKWGQRIYHRERADTTHAAIALAPRLILEANPRGLEENEKGVVEETILSGPIDFKKIHYVFRKPNEGKNTSDAIVRAAFFFRGEKYDYLKIFTSQLLEPLRKTRGAAQYGKTFCSALVQRVAEKSELIPPHPTGKLLSPHALMRYLKSLGWEQIEASRFACSAEEEREKQIRDDLVSARLGRDIVDRSSKLHTTFAASIKKLMSSSEPALRGTLPLLVDTHRVLAERKKLENMLKQVHPDRPTALAKLLEQNLKQPDRLRKILALASGARSFPLDLLDVAPLLGHLQSIQQVTTSNVGHYSIANEMNTLEEMRTETVRWLTDVIEVYEEEAHKLITETRFFEGFESYLDDDIEEKMKKDTKVRDAMTKWERGMDRIATLALQSTLAKGLSLSESRERLLELKRLCASILAAGTLRSRLENLLTERETYLRVLEDWLSFRSAQAGNSTNK